MRTKNEWSHVILLSTCSLPTKNVFHFGSQQIFSGMEDWEQSRMPLKLSVWSGLYGPCLLSAAVSVFISVCLSFCGFFLLRLSHFSLHLFSVLFDVQVAHAHEVCVGGVHRVACKPTAAKTNLSPWVKVESNWTTEEKCMLGDNGQPGPTRSGNEIITTQMWSLSHRYLCL